METYQLIIFGSVILILSFLYGEIAKRTNIPSVLMLMATGVIIGQVYPMEQIDFSQPLKLLGKIGLIMIVLEGALDLHLERKKSSLIFKAFSSSLLGLLITTNVIAVLLYAFLNMEWMVALLYAAPLSIISSAILIPSIASLKEGNREFLVYESCLSDIFGIMVFNFILSSIAESNLAGSLGHLGVSLLLSILFAIIISFGLVFLFKYVKSNVKLFLIIAILFVIYAVAEYFHFEPLLLILFFGIVLKNHELFFGGRLRKYVTRMEMKSMEKNFHIITRETAFVMRTFFFVVFGLFISLESLLSIEVLAISIAAIVLMYGVRFLLLRIMSPKSIQPLVYMAPRGLITILLFYSIPAELKSESFNEGVLLFVILLTSFIMSYGLINNDKKGWELEKVQVDEQEIEPEPLTDTQEDSPESIDGIEEEK